jgi:hypothetical protein
MPKKKLKSKMTHSRAELAEKSSQEARKHLNKCTEFHEHLNALNTGLKSRDWAHLTLKCNQLSAIDGEYFCGMASPGDNH